MKIGLTSVLVDDQEKALPFYTESWASEEARRPARRRTVG